MKVETKLTGVDNVLDMLRRLPPEVVSKSGGPALRALRKGGKVIQRAEIQNLDAQMVHDDDREATGLLRKNIVVSRGKAPTGGKGERVLVRVRRKTYPGRSGKPVTTLQTANLKEYGSSQQEPRSFIRRAFNEKAPEAISTVERELVKDIDRIAKKLLKA